MDFVCGVSFLLCLSVFIPSDCTKHTQQQSVTEAWNDSCRGDEAAHTEAARLQSSAVEPFALNVAALRVWLMNFSKLQMVPHFNDRHFVVFILGPASFATKCSLRIK